MREISVAVRVADATGNDGSASGLLAIAGNSFSRPEFLAVPNHCQTTAKPLGDQPIFQVALRPMLTNTSTNAAAYRIRLM